MDTTTKSSERAPVMKTWPCTFLAEPGLAKRLDDVRRRREEVPSRAALIREFVEAGIAAADAADRAQGST